MVGALDVYAAHEDRFAEAEVALARQLAEHAAVLVDHAIALQGAARLNEQLRQAMASRGTIGEAKGILMEREGCTSDEAFDMLRRASQRENRKLRELAEEIVAGVQGRGADRA